MSDPIEVLLQFAFLGVLYLFLLWVARSALRDLGRPATEPAGFAGEELAAGGAPYSGRLVVQRGAGLSNGEAFGIGPGLGDRAGAGHARSPSRTPTRPAAMRASTTVTATCTSRT